MAVGQMPDDHRHRCCGNLPETNLSSDSCIIVKAQVGKRKLQSQWTSMWCVRQGDKVDFDAHRIGNHCRSHCCPWSRAG
jgi:hypothetical protein